MAIPPPARVLHLITELSEGGAQSALARLLARLDARFAPTIACYYNADGAPARAIRALGIEVIDLGMGSSARVDAMGRLYALLRRIHPAILHTWMFHANIPGRVIGRAAGVPIILSSERTMGQESRVRHMLNRRTAFLADRILCVSDSVRAHASAVIGLPDEKLVVIPNGIDLAAYTPVRHPLDGPLSIGYVGRLEPVKGVPLLLDALALLAANLPECAWRLTLVGDGSQRAALVAQAERLGLAARVEFLGARQDVPALMQGFDLLVLPSLHEGMPNVALEAMACAVPVVATGVGGTPEVVLHGETGLLVPPADAPALAAALAVLAADPERRDAMGTLGRARVETHFALNVTVRRTEALYDALMDRKQV